MLILHRKLGQEVAIPAHGVVVRLVTTYPQLTLSVTTPRGTVTIHPGGSDCAVPGCSVRVKVLEKHQGWARLGFTAPKRTKILRSEIVRREVTGCR